MASNLITCPICDGPLVSRYRAIERVKYRSYVSKHYSGSTHVQELRWCVSCKVVTRVLKASKLRPMYKTLRMAASAGRKALTKRRRAFTRR